MFRDFSTYVFCLIISQEFLELIFQDNTEDVIRLIYVKKLKLGTVAVFPFRDKKYKIIKSELY